MTLKTKSLWLALSGAMLIARPARAQLSAPPEAAHVEFGPVSLYPTLQILDAGIDDNVFNDGVAPHRDYTLTFATKVLTAVRLGSNELLGMVGSEYVWFKEFETERSGHAQYALRFNLSASRFKPFFGAEHIRTRARRSPEIDARARRSDQFGLAGLGFELTPRTSLTASARVDSSKFDEGESFRGVALDDALNRSGHGAEAGVRYALTPLTTLSVLAGFEEQTFEQAHIRDLKRYTVGPSFEFSPEAAIRGRVVTNFEVFKPEDPTLPERKGFSYQALVNWLLYERTSFDLGTGRNISYSYQDTEPYYLLTNVRLLVSQPIGLGLEIYGGGDWEHMAYRWSQDADPAFPESDRVDTLVAVNGGFGVRLGPNFRLRVGVEQTRRRSVEDPVQNFSRTRILSSVTLGS
jgi:Putative beta-barrel porin 2